MGFSQVSAHVVIFIVVSMIVVGMIGFLSSSTFKVRESLELRGDSVKDRISGEFTVTEVYYSGLDAVNNEFYVYLKNTGDRKLEFSEKGVGGDACLDFYVDDVFVPGVLGSDILYPGNATVMEEDGWRPQATIRANLSDKQGTISINQKVKITAVSCGGIQDSYVFSTPSSGWSS